MSKHFGSAALLAFSLTLLPAATALAHKPAHARIDADAIYYNGKVVTMDSTVGKRRHHDDERENYDCQLCPGRQRHGVQLWRARQADEFCR